jgi:hypothetical protein
VASIIVQLPTAAVEARDELSFNNPVCIHINNAEVRINNIDSIIINGNDSDTVDENGVDP